MKSVPNDILKKISDSLEKSSFGSGEMIAGILADPEFEMPVEDGIWDISEEEDRDGEYYYYYSRRRDSYMGGPTWRGKRGFSINIENDTVEFVLGCGVHGASCVFNKKTGDLIEVVPDSLPSDYFWGDGDRPNLSLRARREFLQMNR